MERVNRISLEEEDQPHNLPPPVIDLTFEENIDDSNGFSNSQPESAAILVDAKPSTSNQDVIDLTTEQEVANTIINISNDPRAQVSPVESNNDFFVDPIKNLAEVTERILFSSDPLSTSHKDHSEQRPVDKDEQPMEIDTDEVSLTQTNVSENMDFTVNSNDECRSKMQELLDVIVITESNRDISPVAGKIQGDIQIVGGTVMSGNSHKISLSSHEEKDPSDGKIQGDLLVEVDTVTPENSYEINIPSSNKEKNTSDGKIQEDKQAKEGALIPGNFHKINSLSSNKEKSPSDDNIHKDMQVEAGAFIPGNYHEINSPSSNREKSLSNDKIHEGVQVEVGTVILGNSHLLTSPSSCNETNPSNGKIQENKQAKECALIPGNSQKINSNKEKSPCDGNIHKDMQVEVEAGIPGISHKITSPSSNKELSPSEGKIQEDTQAEEDALNFHKINSPSRNKEKSPDDGNIQEDMQVEVEAGVPENSCKITSPLSNKETSPSDGKIQEDTQVEEDALIPINSHKINSPSSNKEKGSNGGNIQEDTKMKVDAGAPRIFHKIDSSSNNKEKSSSNDKIQEDIQVEVSDATPGNFHKIKGPSSSKEKSPSDGKIQKDNINPEKDINVLENSRKGNRTDVEEPTQRYSTVFLNDSCKTPSKMPDSVLSSLAIAKEIESLAKLHKEKLQNREITSNPTSTSCELPIVNKSNENIFKENRRQNYSINKESVVKTKEKEKGTGGAILLQDKRFPCSNLAGDTVSSTKESSKSQADSISQFDLTDELVVDETNTAMYNQNAAKSIDLHNKQTETTESDSSNKASQNVIEIELNNKIKISGKNQNDTVTTTDEDVNLLIEEVHNKSVFSSGISKLQKVSKVSEIEREGSVSSTSEILEVANETSSKLLENTLKTCDAELKADVPLNNTSKNPIGNFDVASIIRQEMIKMLPDLLKEMQKINTGISAVTTNPFTSSHIITSTLANTVQSSKGSSLITDKQSHISSLAETLQSRALNASTATSIGENVANTTKPISETSSALVFPKRPKKKSKTKLKNSKTSPNSTATVSSTSKLDLLKSSPVFPNLTTQGNSGTQPASLLTIQSTEPTQYSKTSLLSKAQLEGFIQNINKERAVVKTTSTVQDTTLLMFSPQQTMTPVARNVASVISKQPHVAAVLSKESAVVKTSYTSAVQDTTLLMFSPQRTMTPVAWNVTNVISNQPHVPPVISSIASGSSSRKVDIKQIHPQQILQTNSIPSIAPVSASKVLLPTTDLTSMKLDPRGSILVPVTLDQQGSLIFPSNIQPSVTSEHYQHFVVSQTVVRQQFSTTTSLKSTTSQLSSQAKLISSNDMALYSVPRVFRDAIKYPQGNGNVYPGPTSGYVYPGPTSGNVYLGSTSVATLNVDQIRPNIVTNQVSISNPMETGFLVNMEVPRDKSHKNLLKIVDPSNKEKVKKSKKVFEKQTSNITEFSNTVKTTPNVSSVKNVKRSKDFIAIGQESQRSNIQSHDSQFKLQRKIKVGKCELEFDDIIDSKTVNGEVFYKVKWSLCSWESSKNLKQGDLQSQISSYGTRKGKGQDHYEANDSVDFTSLNVDHENITEKSILNIARTDSHEESTSEDDSVFDKIEEDQLSPLDIIQRIDRLENENFKFSPHKKTLDNEALTEKIVKENEDKIPVKVQEYVEIKPIVLADETNEESLLMKGFDLASIVIKKKKKETSPKSKETKTCEHCGIILSLPDFVKHQRAFTKYQCPVCKLRICNKKDLIRHIKNHRNPCFQCYRCFVEFENEKLFNEHKKGCHQVALNAKSNELKLETLKRKIYKCKTCKKDFESVLSFARHRKLSHKRKSEKIPIECVVCRKRFSTVEKCKSHVELHQIVFEECQECGECFDVDEKITSHICTGKPKVKYVSVTKAVLEKIKVLPSRKNKKKITMNMASGKANYCLKCIRGFKNQDSFYEHINFDECPSVKENGSCMTCRKRFIEVLDLKNHLKRCFRESLTSLLKPHSKTKSNTPEEIKKSVHRCSHCKTLFPSKHAFRSHGKILHTKLTKYQCKKCRFFCYSRRLLQKHIRLNLCPKLERFSCFLCDEGRIIYPPFGSLSQLIEHLKDHQKETKTKKRKKSVMVGLKPVQIRNEAGKTRLINIELKDIQKLNGKIGLCEVAGFGKYEIQVKGNYPVQTLSVSKVSVKPTSEEKKDKRRIVVKNEKYKCFKCLEEFSDHQEILVHFRYIHKYRFIQLIKCDKCNTTFKDNASWVLHKEHCGTEVQKINKLREDESGTVKSSEKENVKDNELCVCGDCQVLLNANDQEKAFIKKVSYCHKCKLQFPCRRHLNIHYALVHPSKSVYLCDNCDTPFIKIALLRKHCQEYHSFKEKDLKDFKPTMINVTWDCPLCKKQFKDIKWHALSHSTVLFECYKCNVKISNDRLLRKHMSAYHAVQWSLTDEKCIRKIQTENIQEIVEHIYWKEGYGSVQKTAQKLEQVSSKANKKCSSCQAMFFHPLSLKRHLATNSCQNFSKQTARTNSGITGNTKTFKIISSNSSHDDYCESSDYEDFEDMEIDEVASPKPKSTDTNHSKNNLNIKVKSPLNSTTPTAIRGNTTTTSNADGYTNIIDVSKVSQTENVLIASTPALTTPSTSVTTVVAPNNVLSTPKSAVITATSTPAGSQKASNLFKLITPPVVTSSPKVTTPTFVNIPTPSKLTNPTVITIVPPPANYTVTSCNKVSTSQDTSRYVIKRSKVQPVKKDKSSEKKSKEKVLPSKNDQSKPEVKDDQLKKSSSCKTAKYMCAQCKEEFTIFDALLEHVRIMHPYYECHICRALCRTKKHYTSHIYVVHGISETNLRNYVLEISEKLFVKDFENKQYNCKYCDLVFAEEIYYYKHLYTHIDKMIEVCNICQKRLSTVEALKIHMKKEHNTIFCICCYRSFHNTAEFVSHCQLHILDVNIPRDDKGKMVIHIEEDNSKGELVKLFEDQPDYLPLFSISSKVPKNVIEDDRLFYCNVCHKNIEGELTFIVHMNTHSEPRKLTCLVCSYSYENVGELEKHYKKHFDKKNEVDSSTVKDMEDAVHDEEMFKCKACSQVFDDSISLTEHMGKTFPKIDKISDELSSKLWMYCQFKMNKKNVKKFKAWSSEFFMARNDLMKIFNWKAKETLLQIHPQIDQRSKLTRYVCQICFILLPLSEVHKHLIGHLHYFNSKTVSCSLCTQKTMLRIDFMSHMWKEHSLKLKDRHNVKCQFCYVNLTRSEIESHMLKHQQELTVFSPDIFCAYCNMLLSKQNILKHMMLYCNPDTGNSETNDNIKEPIPSLEELEHSTKGNTAKVQKTGSNEDTVKEKQKKENSGKKLKNQDEENSSIKTKGKIKPTFVNEKKVEVSVMLPTKTKKRQIQHKNEMVAKNKPAKAEPRKSIIKTRKEVKINTENKLPEHTGELTSETNKEVVKSPTKEVKNQKTNEEKSDEMKKHVKGWNKKKERKRSSPRVIETPTNTVQIDLVSNDSSLSSPLKVPQSTSKVKSIIKTRKEVESESKKEIDLAVFKLMVDCRDLTCSLCDIQFTDLSQLKQHLTLHVKTDNGIILKESNRDAVCVFCGKFIRKSSMKTHVLMAHPKEVANYQRSVSVKTTPGKGEMVKLITKNEDEQPLLKATPYPFTCGVCLRGYFDCGPYLQHYKLKHPVLYEPEKNRLQSIGVTIPKEKRKLADVKETSTKKRKKKDDTKITPEKTKTQSEFTRSTRKTEKDIVSKRLSLTTPEKTKKNSTSKSPGSARKIVRPGRPPISFKLEEPATATKSKLKTDQRKDTKKVVQKKKNNKELTKTEEDGDNAGESNSSESEVEEETEEEILSSSEDEEKLGRNTDKDFHCQPCNENFKTEKEYDLHVLQHQEVPGDQRRFLNLPFPYVCLFCGLGCFKTSSLKRHLQTKHGSLYTKDLENSKQFMNKVTDSKEDFKKHAAKVEIKETLLKRDRSKFQAVMGSVTGKSKTDSVTVVEKKTDEVVNMVEDKSSEVGSSSQISDETGRRVSGRKRTVNDDVMNFLKRNKETKNPQISTSENSVKANTAKQKTIKIGSKRSRASVKSTAKISPKPPAKKAKLLHQKKDESADESSEEETESEESEKKDSNSKSESESDDETSNEEQATNGDTETSGDEIDVSDESEAESSDEDSDDDNICKYCDIIMASSKSLKKHQKKHFRGLKSTSNELICTSCRITVQRHELKWHMHQSHANEPRHKLSSKKVFCTKCTYSAKTSKHLDLHIIENHQELLKIECRLCDQRFLTQEKYSNHFRDSHGKSFDEELKLCYLCNKKFPTVANLYQHYSIVHMKKNENYFCSLCSKYFYGQNDYDKHQDEYHKHDKFQCGLCLIEFEDPELCEAHVLVHKKKSKFRCTICSFYFETEEILKNHLSTHKDDLTCKQCHIIFSTGEELSVHECQNGVDGNQEKSYKCTICDKNFVSTDEIGKHMRTVHYGGNESNDDENTVQTFSQNECEICGETFIRAEIFEEHMRKKHT